MPRHTLPTELKRFASFEVLLTQTTEDEIWTYLRSAMTEFDEKADAILTVKSNFISSLYDTNPYLDDDFKFSVERLTPYDWTGQCNNYNEFMKKYNLVLRDLELCRKVLWTESEDEEKIGLINEWVFAIEKFKSIITDNDEFKAIDTSNYSTASRLWREKNANFIKQKQEVMNHAFCSYPDLYPKPHIEGEHYYLRGVTQQYFNKDCPICLRTKNSYYDEIEFNKRTEQENYEKDRLYKAECEARRERLRLEEEERRKNLPLHECNICNYKTHYASEYKDHLESKEHITKQNLRNWHCVHCNIQPRNEIEHIHHISTKKHKIATGEMEAEPLEYHCEKCDFTTPLKQNWERHLKSVKHNKDKKDDNNFV